MDKNMTVTHTKTNLGTQSTRIVLTSQNNAQVKELWAQLSQQVMKKMRIFTEGWPINEYRTPYTASSREYITVS